MRSKFLKISMALLIISLIGDCSLFRKKKDNNDMLTLVLLAAALGGRDMYAGFADIPASIYKTSTSATSSERSDTKTLSTADYKFVNSDKSSSVSKVYDLVRVTAKGTRDIAKSIGDLVKALEALNISVSTTAITGTGTWADQPSKYSYKSSSKLAGGKLLEVWWNNASAPYSNNKAIEMNYTGSTSSGDISGFLWVRFISTTGANTLSKAYIKFDYNASTNTRNMIVILQDVGTTFTDKAHFFVKEINGITQMDGGYTVLNFNPKSTGVSASDRVYVFNAAGDATKAVLNAALPLTSDTTTAIYSNTALGNIGQVWTNFILANSAVATAVNPIGGSCANTSIKTTPSSGNPTNFTNVTTVAQLKSCLDEIVTAQSSTSSVKDVYFLTNIKNPAYFTYANQSAVLYGVESLESTDLNKAAFDALYAKLLTSTRLSSDTTYSASMDALTISTINLFTGVGIPLGTTANTLPSLNSQWGNGAPGTGTSSASAGANTVNGSIDNTAPF